jgi:hypothetical protein
MNIIGKTVSCIAAVLSVHFAAPAQEQNKYSVSGSVIDESGAEAVVNFYLAVRQDSVVVADAVTDESGGFSFNLPEGSYVLLGYYWGKLLTEVAINVSHSVELPPWKVNTVLNLSEVQVTANRKVIRREENKMVFDVQNMSAIESYKAVDIFKYIPLVNVTPDNVVTLGNSPATVFSDGRRLTVEETSVYLQTLNAKDIEKIEVQQANDGTQQADVRGGIINIVTKSKRSGFDFTSHNNLSATNADNREITPSVNVFWGKENYSLYAAYKFESTGKTSKYSNTDNYMTDGITYSKPDEHEMVKRNRHDFTIGSIMHIGRKSIFNISLNRNYADARNTSHSSILCVSEKHRTCNDLVLRYNFHAGTSGQFHLRRRYKA